jgi:hypothetical protein
MYVGTQGKVLLNFPNAGKLLFNLKYAWEFRHNGWEIVNAKAMLQK